MGRLSDALKALFGSNKTTGTYVPLVTSNGTPDGNITTANIAALLGGLRATTYTDLNDTPQGVTVGNTGSGCLNVPDGWAGGVAISANRNSIYQLQILVNYTATKFYLRLKWGANWTMVDLASMLKEGNYKGNLSSTDDFNTIGEGIYNFSSNSIPAHAPSGLSVSGVIECRFLTSNQNVRMQTITASNGNQYVRIRYSSSDTWFEWKQIYP